MSDGQTAERTPDPDAPVIDRLDRAMDSINEVILGKPHQIRLCVACLLARGHLLIEDVPGVGKTTLAQSLAKSLGLSYQRIQFTSDLLPADIIGVSVYHRESGNFVFHPGPVFSQLVLADEVNRATPKAQSALLEAMEEHQVTSDGQTRTLPEPFFVIATQNPSFQVGTFPLPESQLDRFLMRVELGYPAEDAERELLRGADRRHLVREVQARIEPEELVGLQDRVKDVYVSEALLDYAQAIVRQSRSSPAFEAGLSPRAAIALVQAARAWAMLDGRDGVLPEDIQTILPGVVGHRLRIADSEERTNEAVIASELVDKVPIP